MWWATGSDDESTSRRKRRRRKGWALVRVDAREKEREGEREEGE